MMAGRADASFLQKNELVLLPYVGLRTRIVRRGDLLFALADCYAGLMTMTDETATRAIRRRP